MQITPLTGDPPTELQITYVARVLVMDEAGQLLYTPQCFVHLWLPPEFPEAPPVLRPMSNVFHPNVTADWIHQYPAWNAHGSVADVVRRTGQLLTLQDYDAGAILNPEAMEWVAANAALLPLDTAADFAPDTNGEPLARISRFGAETLAEYESQLRAACERILSPAGSASLADARQSALRLRPLLRLFTEADIPEALRRRAIDLDAWISALDAPDARWQAMQDEARNLRALLAASSAAAAAEESLAAAIRSVESLVRQEPHPDPANTLQMIPGLEVLDPVSIELRRRIGECEQAAALLRQRLEESSPIQLPPTAGASTPVERFLATKISEADAASKEARDHAIILLRAAEHALNRAKREAAAFDVITAWASYSELMGRGRALVKKVRSLGSAGVQAYFLEGQGSRTGPFDFEDLIDVGGSSATVRLLAPGSIELLDELTSDALGSGNGESISVIMRRKSGQPFQMIVLPTPHPDELRVQIEYLLNQTHDRLTRLTAPPPQAQSWVGRFTAALARPNAMAALRAMYTQTTTLWKALLGDIAAASRFKERLATFYLLRRLSEVVPKLLRHIAISEEAAGGASRIVAEIASRSSRDVNTDQLIVPRDRAEEYVDQLARHERAQREAARARKALSRSADQVRVRVASPRRYGSPVLPSFDLVEPLPPPIVDLAESLSDRSLQARIDQLEKLLGVPLRPTAAQSKNQADGARR